MRIRASQSAARVAIALALALSLASCKDVRAERRTFPIAAPFTGVWRGQMTLPRLSYDKPDELAIDVSFQAPRDVWQSALKDVVALHVAVVGERIYDSEGHPHRWSNVAGSTLLTVSGFPIETYQFVLPVKKFGHPYGSPIEMTANFPAGDWRANPGRTLRARLSAPLADAPDGYYRLHADVFGEFAGGALISMNQWQIFMNDSFLRHGLRGLTQLGWGFWRQSDREAPVIRVGRPRRPKMIWTLLTRGGINGQRGVVAEEDKPYFAVSNRFRLPAPFIVPPGKYDLTPGAPLDRDAIGDGSISPFSPNALAGAKTSYALQVVDPKGRTVIRKTGTLGEYEDGRAAREFECDVRSYGEYSVILKGELVDRYGWRYDAGGTYRIWAADPLTISTSVKPGTPFLRGASFPTKALINPPVAADVAYDIRHYPYSDASRLHEKHVRGSASPYGYFLPTDPADAFVFDEPGEYASNLTVSYRAPDGRLMMGSQTSGGVVAEPDGATRAHGRKWLEPGVTVDDVAASSRFLQLRDGKIGDVHRDLFDCIPYPAPHNSGDVLYVAESPVGATGISNELTLEIRDEKLRNSYLNRFPHGLGDVLGYLYRGPGLVRLPDVLRTRFRSNFWSLLCPYFDRRTMIDMLPTLSATRNGWPPADFPEYRNIISYFYFSAIKPGATPQFMVGDATASNLYWTINNTTYDRQINVAPEGDLPTEIYRFQGGTVFRDLDGGMQTYAAYSSMGVIQEAGQYRNRVTAPFAEPLLEASGRRLWSFLGADPAIIVRTGETALIAGQVFPTVETDVTITIRGPDGATTTLAGRTNRLGAFAVPGSAYRPKTPGVYHVQIAIAGGEQPGNLVGADDGGYNFYVVDADAPRATPLLSADLPPASSWRPAGQLTIPLLFQPGLKNKRLTYSLEMPGALLDEESFDVTGDRFDYVFDPRQIRRRAPNFQWDPRNADRALTDESVFFVFFLDADDAAGRHVVDAVKIMLRRNRVFNFPKPRLTP